MTGKHNINFILWTVSKAINFKVKYSVNQGTPVTEENYIILTLTS